MSFAPPLTRPPYTSKSSILAAKREQDEYGGHALYNDSAHPATSTAAVAGLSDHFNSLLTKRTLTLEDVKRGDTEQHDERLMFTLFQRFGGKLEQWQHLRNARFFHYLLSGALLIDISKLENEWVDVIFKFVIYYPTYSVIKIIDSTRINSIISSSSSQHRLLTRSFKRTNTINSIENYVIDKLQRLLPIAINRHYSELLHIEFDGLHIENWIEISKVIRKCSNLKRLYFRNCNLSDTSFEAICSSIHDISVNYVIASNCQLTSLSSTTLCHLIHCQSERRAGLEWMLNLRNNNENYKHKHQHLLEQGLQSIDISYNEFGDQGIVDLMNCLKNDIWIIYLNISNNKFDELAINSIIDMLKYNKSLIKLHLLSDIDQNIINNKFSTLLSQLDYHYLNRQKQFEKLILTQQKNNNVNNNNKNIIYILPQLHLSVEVSKIFNEEATLRSQSINQRQILKQNIQNLISPNNSYQIKNHNFNQNNNNHEDIQLKESDFILYDKDLSFNNYLNTNNENNQKRKSFKKNNLSKSKKTSQSLKSFKNSDILNVLNNISNTNNLRNGKTTDLLRKSSSLKDFSQKSPLIKSSKNDSEVIQKIHLLNNVMEQMENKLIHLQDKMNKKTKNNKITLNRSKSMNKLTTLNYFQQIQNKQRAHSVPPKRNSINASVDISSVLQNVESSFDKLQHLMEKLDIKTKLNNHQSNSYLKRNKSVSPSRKYFHELVDDPSDSVSHNVIQ